MFLGIRIPFVNGVLHFVCWNLSLQKLFFITLMKDKRLYVSLCTRHLCPAVYRKSLFWHMFRKKDCLKVVLCFSFFIIYLPVSSVLPSLFITCDFQI